MTHDPLFIIAVNVFIAVFSRCFKPNLLSAMLLAVVMIASGGYLGTHHGDEIMGALNYSRDQALTWVGRTTNWPPEKGQTYPDLTLVDQEGNPTRLMDFKGKVILVEMVGMSCPACVAFSGGRKAGAFGSCQPQHNLESIEEYVQRFAGVRFDDSRLVFVQILLFNQQMGSPTVDELRAWADHFGFRRDRNQLVLGGANLTANEASLEIVPGFQLLDKNFVLRYDSTGAQPKDDLYSALLPQILPLMEE
jgi:thiol-disulfide isomerase/thioredoxin